MLNAIQKFILAITKQGSDRKMGQDARRLLLGAIADRANFKGNMDGLLAAMEKYETEAASWIAPEAVRERAGGSFDACDLRHWLQIAELAGVPAIPAREILSLTEEEMSVASGGISLPENVSKRLAGMARQYMTDSDMDPDALPELERADPERVQEMLCAAMDDIPEGWMVRHVRAGPESLKALAGCGIAGPEAPEVRFNADIEIGPGWIRRGNRRQVDTTDGRIVQVCASAPPGDLVFVARPWVTANRFFTGEDPHRAGTKIAGPGAWPAEWRAFVERGVVTGVSVYYPWSGSVTPENAAMALEVRDLAQRIATLGSTLDFEPVFMDHEFARNAKGPQPEAFRERFPRGTFSCSLDFIETDEGPVLLEGGPACTPIGGGHPCGFAGLDKPEGVAMKTMPGINIAEPKTWRQTEIVREGSILTWDEVEALASTPSMQP